MEDLSLTIEKVISYWQAQNIKIMPRPMEEIQDINKAKALHLPDDFARFYNRANGMEDYPQKDYDDEGFGFCRVEDIVSAREEFGDDTPLGKRKIFVFLDYMVRCWCYGYEVFDDGSYTIGIIPSNYKFKVITNSLAKFLDLYMADSELLYDYGNLDEQE